jgi:DNA-binding transcriptional ArsR family regulator
MVLSCASVTLGKYGQGAEKESPKAVSGRFDVYMQLFTCLFSCRGAQMTADKVFKALGDPTRRKVLDLLCEKNGQTLGQLCEHLAMTRQSATQHLDLLEEANLVSTVRRGREKLHFINPVPLHDIYERWVRKFEMRRLTQLHDLKRELERKPE